MRFLCFVLGMFFLSANALAAQVWLENLTIESYKMYYLASTNDTVVEVRVREGVSTGCPTTDNNRLFSYWSVGANAHHEMWLQQIMAADAQGRKIDIFYDNAVCSGIAGRRLLGVHVRPEI